MKRSFLRLIKLLLRYVLLGLLCFYVYKALVLNTKVKFWKDISGHNITRLSSVREKQPYLSNVLEDKRKQICTLDYDCEKGHSIPIYKRRRDLKKELYRLTYRDKITYDAVVENYPGVSEGGVWTPSNCRPTSKLALVIPYRNRKTHLLLLLQHILQFLQKQKVAFRIFVIEQEGEVIFNRAALLNIGYLEASKLDNYDCYVFHDVDLLPEDRCNLYRCSRQPRHLACAMNKFHFNLPYSFYVGGVLALSKSIVETINGFTNTMYGWGGEDDDTYARLRKHGYSIERYNRTICKYTMIKHKRDRGNPVSERSNYDVTNHWRYSDYDGLKSVNYTIRNITFFPLHTHITIDLPGPTDKLTIKEHFAAKELEFIKMYYANNKNVSENDSVAAMLRDEMKDYSRPRRKPT